MATIFGNPTGAKTIPTFITLCALVIVVTWTVVEFISIYTPPRFVTLAICALIKVTVQRIPDTNTRVTFVVYRTLIVVGTIRTILLLRSGTFIGIFIAKRGVALRFVAIVIIVATILYVLVSTKISSTKINTTWIFYGTIQIRRTRLKKEKQQQQKQCYDYNSAHDYHYK
tara:strand:- start:2975 stop:3484 length:510 start_codon:yes stop_codon:yes gene_type:complete